MTFKVRGGTTCLAAASTSVLEMATCNNSAAQQFKLARLNDSASNRRYELRSVQHPTMCADAPTSSTALQLFPCHRGPNQQWELLVPQTQSTSSRSTRAYGLQLHNVATDTFLGGARWPAQMARSLSHAFDVQVHHFDSSLVSLESTLFSDRCMDVPSSSQASVQVNGAYACHFGLNQQWRLAADGNGRFAIRAQHSQKCLDVPNAGTSVVNQFACHGGANQQFTIRIVDGDVFEVNSSRGQSLQAALSNTMLVAAPPNTVSSTSQLWRIGSMALPEAATSSTSTAGGTSLAFDDNGWLNVLRLLIILGTNAPTAIGLTGHYEGRLCSGNSCAEVGMNLSHPNTLVNGQYRLTGELMPYDSTLTFNPGALCPNMNMPVVTVTMSGGGPTRFAASGSLTQPGSSFLGVGGDVRINYSVSLDQTNLEALTVTATAITPFPCANVTLSGVLRRKHWDF